MIRIFYGDDRVTARKQIDRQLGDDYEIVEGESLTVGDMPSVLLGTSLFATERAILIKDLSENKECFAMLPQLVGECPHNVVIWEAKLDKRSAAYKELTKDKNVEFKEFKLAEDPDKKLVFDILDMAFRGDGKSALKACEKIELTNDAFMFMGLMTTQAIKKLQYNNPKAVRAIKILAQADMDMKTSGLEPWEAVKIALLKIAK